jgi:hypothetical protein
MPVPLMVKYEVFRWCNQCMHLEFTNTLTATTLRCSCLCNEHRLQSSACACFGAHWTTSPHSNAHCTVLRCHILAVHALYCVAPSGAATARIFGGADRFG